MLGSFVWTFTTTSRMPAGAVRMVFTSVILSFGSFRAGATLSAESRDAASPAAPVASAAVFNQSRRSMGEVLSNLDYLSRERGCCSGFIRSLALRSRLTHPMHSGDNREFVSAHFSHFPLACAPSFRYKTSDSLPEAYSCNPACLCARGSRYTDSW